MVDAECRAASPGRLGEKERHMARREGFERWLTSGAAAALAIGLTLGVTACAAPGTSTGTASYSTGATSQRAAAGAPSNVALESAPAASKDAAAGVGTDASSIPKDQRLVVKNKTMRIEVDAVTATIDKLRAMASRDGADITQMQVATTNDQPIYRPLTEGETMPNGDAALQAYVVIRVPATKYQAFIDEAAKLGKVLIQTEKTDDVTQQHIDLKARLDNLRAEEARLREFFAKAKTVAEMLQIENELSRVRGEIESMAAQVAYLERQAAMATVTIELAEPKPLVRPGGIDWGVGTAFTDSVRAFVGTLNVLIVMLGPILAIGLFVVLPVALIGRLVWRLLARRRAARAVAADPESEGPTQS
jgi:hypothetical protein